MSHDTFARTTARPPRRADATPVRERTRPLRATLRRLHLWLGLPLGLLLVVSGLSGTALVFYTEIDRALVPALRAVPADARPASWQAVATALQRDHPARTGAWRIEVTPYGGAIPVRYHDPVETRGQAFAPLMLWLDPRDLRTVRSGFWGRYPTTWLYRLHWQLLAGRTGEVVMALAGAATLVLLASGLAAWWPRPGHWREGLRWKRRAAPVRRLYDVHKLVAVASAGVLLVVVATGILLELPAQTRPLLARASPLFAAPDLAVAARAGAALPLDDLVARAQRRFPGARLAWIETAAGPTAPVRITLAQPGEPSRRFPRTTIWLDPRSGAVLALRDGRREGAGDIVLNWLHPVHAGEAFGPAGRIAALLSGLAAAALAATGWWRWSIRRRRRS